jgi:hypothetical protein
MAHRDLRRSGSARCRFDQRLVWRLRSINTIRSVLGSWITRHIRMATSGLSYRHESTEAADDHLQRPELLFQDAKQQLTNVLEDPENPLSVSRTAKSARASNCSPTLRRASRPVGGGQSAPVPCRRCGLITPDDARRRP